MQCNTVPCDIMCTESLYRTWPTCNRAMAMAFSGSSTTQQQTWKHSTAVAHTGMGAYHTHWVLVGAIGKLEEPRCCLEDVHLRELQRVPTQEPCHAGFKLVPSQVQQHPPLPAHAAGAPQAYGTCGPSRCGAPQAYDTCRPGRCGAPQAYDPCRPGRCGAPAAPGALSPSGVGLLQGREGPFCPAYPGGYAIRVLSHTW